MVKITVRWRSRPATLVWGWLVGWRVRIPGQIIRVRISNSVYMFQLHHKRNKQGQLAVRGGGTRSNGMRWSRVRILLTKSSRSLPDENDTLMRSWDIMCKHHSLQSLPVAMPRLVNCLSKGRTNLPKPGYGLVRPPFALLFEALDCPSPCSGSDSMLVKWG